MKGPVSMVYLGAARDPGPLSSATDPPDWLSDDHCGVGVGVGGHGVVELPGGGDGEVAGVAAVLGRCPGRTATPVATAPATQCRRSTGAGPAQEASVCRAR